MICCVVRMFGEVDTLFIDYTPCTGKYHESIAVCIVSWKLKVLYTNPSVYILEQS